MIYAVARNFFVKQTSKFKNHSRLYPVVFTCLMFPCDSQPTIMGRAQQQRRAIYIRSLESETDREKQSVNKCGWRKSCISKNSAAVAMIQLKSFSLHSFE